MDKIRIVPLGGLDEFYKTCTVIEINDDIFVVECGLKFPDVTKPGIDYVIPRYDYLLENKDRVRAYFLTFGHDPVIGGLPYIIDKIPAPVYCTDITKVFLEMFCRHNHLDTSKIDFRIVNPSDELIVSGHKIYLFSTCMNIARSFGIAFDTDQGYITYIGNTVYDNNNDVGFMLDLRQIAKISATKSTLVFLNASDYATKKGYTNPNYRILPLCQKIINDHPGRIIIALEAPDIYNIIAVLNEAVHAGRKIICYDESTQDVVDAMLESKCLKLDKKDFLPMGEVNRTRAQEILVLMTGFGSKLFNKISLLATHLNDEQILQLNKDDAFIIGSHNEDSSEVAFTNALNDLYRNDCKIHVFSSKTFLKMHSSEEDIKTSLSIFRPKYYIPTNGNLVDLFANAKIAASMNIGLNHNNVFVLDNGMVVEFENYFAKVLPQKVIAGNVYVDGKGIGDTSTSVIEERQKISGDGVIILAATVSKSKREIVLGPDIQSRGLVFVKENDSLMKEILRVFVLNIKQELAKPNYSISYMEMSVKEQVFKTIRRSTLKSPSIIPIILEID